MSAYTVTLTINRGTEWISDDHFGSLKEAVARFHQVAGAHIHDRNACVLLSHGNITLAAKSTDGLHAEFHQAFYLASQPPAPRDIRVRYESIDSYGRGKTRRFKTLAGASKWAREWLGDHPERGSWYAVSDDGVGKITCQGCSLGELFPDDTRTSIFESTDDECPF